MTDRTDDRIRNWANNLLSKIKSFLLNWFKKNKWLAIIAVVIILLGILPVYPSFTTETIKLDVPTVPTSWGSSTKKILTTEQCNYLDFYPLSHDLKRIPLTKPDNSYSADTKEPETISYEFDGYIIHIFAVKSCNECANYNSLRLLEEKTCLMNNASVLGFFEKCEMAEKNKVCKKTPFMVSDGVELVAPNKEFKIEIKPYIQRTKYSENNAEKVNDNYYVEFLVTYPDWKPLPYIKWVGSAFLFLLDPIKSIIRYFVDKWSLH